MMDSNHSFSLISKIQADLFSKNCGKPIGDVEISISSNAELLPVFLSQWCTTWKAKTLQRTIKGCSMLRLHEICTMILCDSRKFVQMMNAEADNQGMIHDVCPVAAKKSSNGAESKVSEGFTFFYIGPYVPLVNIAHFLACWRFMTSPTRSFGMLDCAGIPVEIAITSQDIPSRDRPLCSFACQNPDKAFWLHFPQLSNSCIQPIKAILQTKSYHFLAACFLVARGDSQVIADLLGGWYYAYLEDLSGANLITPDGKDVASCAALGDIAIHLFTTTPISHSDLVDQVITRFCNCYRGNQLL